MHFSVPETQELTDKQGSTFVGYSIQVNGIFHCILRYRQLYNFHEQLKKAYGLSSLPFFPPKKLLPLSQAQVEERRVQLEKYVQIISQNQKIVNSELFSGFFLNAQQESKNAKSEEVTFEVFLMNWQPVKVKIISTDRTSSILEAVAKALNLPEHLVAYFCLFAVNRTDNSNVLMRRMQNFEAPFLSLATMNAKLRCHCLVIRKCYWDSCFDEDLLEDRVALNLLYAQTLSDVERGWIHASKDVKRQLTQLQAKGSKKEYLQLARTLKYYGYIEFESCCCDYPQSNTRMTISAGGKELNMRTESTSSDQAQEFSFRVTRIRCWRLTTSLNDPVNGTSGTSGGSSLCKTMKLELSFEYLVNKDTLRWITIVSDQAILLSICLQGMVEELLLKRKGMRLTEGEDMNSEAGLRRSSWSYMKRDGSSRQINIPRSVSTDTFANGEGKAVRGLKKSASSSVSFARTASGAKGRPLVENDAFDGIGDDDL